MRILFGLALLGGLAIATGTRADPCKAIPDRGPMPSYLYRGAHFSGPVVYVGDGDSLCVAVGQGPANWVEVRLEDFYSPELHSQSGGRVRDDSVIPI
jgi:micrococcal nuclease